MGKDISIADEIFSDIKEHIEDYFEVGETTDIDCPYCNKEKKQHFMAVKQLPVIHVKTK